MYYRCVHINHRMPVISGNADYNTEEILVSPFFHSVFQKSIHYCSLVWYINGIHWYHHVC